MRHGQYIAAAISLPLCFALWGIVHLVWRRAGIDSNRIRFAVFHPVLAFRTCLPVGAEVESNLEDIDDEDDDGYDVEGFDDEDYLG
jgi:hypothetical protein